MSECLSIIAPIVLLNFVATTLGVVLGRYLDRILWEERDEYEVLEKSDSEESEDEISDSDLIASVRNDTDNIKQKDLLTMVGTTLKRTYDILDGSSELKSDQKHALVCILNGIPDLIKELDKCADNASKELQTAITKKVIELTNFQWIKEESVNSEAQFGKDNSNETLNEEVDESEYLMNKLDSLQ